MAPIANADWQKFVSGLRQAGMAVVKAGQSQNVDKVTYAPGPSPPRAARVMTSIARRHRRRVVPPIGVCRRKRRGRAGLCYAG